MGVWVGVYTFLEGRGGVRFSVMITFSAVVRQNRQFSDPYTLSLEMRVGKCEREFGAFGTWLGGGLSGSA